MDAARAPRRSRTSCLPPVPGRYHLVLAAPVAVHGHAFAAELVGVEKHVLDVLDSCAILEVDGFRHRVVGVFLEGRLQGDVPARFDIVRRDEHLADALGDAVNFIEAAAESATIFMSSSE